MVFSAFNLMHANTSGGSTSFFFTETDPIPIGWLCKAMSKVGGELP